MSARVDVAGILERAGADADAPEGSQAWALAQVIVAVTELAENARMLSKSITFRIDDPRCELHCKLADSLARIGEWP